MTTTLDISSHQSGKLILMVLGSLGVIRLGTLVKVTLRQIEEIHARRRSAPADFDPIVYSVIRMKFQAPKDTRGKPRLARDNPHSHGFALHRLDH